MLPPTIPLFPLPNVVLFPGVFLPLHIFEPRYRTMTEEALDGDRLIGMVLLKPGYEAEYEGRPPIYPIGCSGLITHAEVDRSAVDRTQKWLGFGGAAAAPRRHSRRLYPHARLLVPSFDAGFRHESLVRLTSGVVHRVMEGMTYGEHRKTSQNCAAGFSQT